MGIKVSSSTRHIPGRIRALQEQLPGGRGRERGAADFRTRHCLLLQGSEHQFVGGCKKFIPALASQVLPGPAWVLLKKIYKPFFPNLNSPEDDEWQLLARMEHERNRSPSFLVPDWYAGCTVDGI